MERIIFHIDVNNAYLSWEALYRMEQLGETVDLRTIPSAVGGDQASRHGIILAKSMPARACGVRTAETLGEARKKCPELLIVPPHMDLYRQYSRKFIALLHRFSPVIEQYSVDEAFADMSGAVLMRRFSPVEAANILRQTIRDTLGFTVNVGVSSNKLLAKMASDFEKPDKVHSLFPDEIREKMWPLPVDTLFFVGHATRNKLHNLGIRTIGELAAFDRKIICDHLGKHGALIHDYANGIDHSPVAAEPADNKGYGNSITLPHDITEPAEARKHLLSLCESVGRRLRADHVMAGVVAVSVKAADFTRGSHQCTLTSPTNVTGELYDNACRLFDEYWDGSPIRLIGVSTSKITKESMRQLNLLDQDKYLRQSKLETALDGLRKKFGDNAVMRASFLPPAEESAKNNDKE